MIGTGLIDGAGLLKGLQLVVSDMDAAARDLAGRGIDTGEVQELGPPGSSGYRFVFFNDPDGNGWAVQEIRPTGRSSLPGNATPRPPALAPGAA